MAERYEFFEHTADIGVHVFGATLPELFANAAAALYDTLGQFALASPPAVRFLQLTAGSVEDLLHDWLAELLYDLETRHVGYERWEFTRLDANHLTATAQGRTVDFARSQVNEEIKAVTYHQLRVAQQPDGSWRATVIFDV
jgi:SHS2 domain-containing protein